MTVTVRLNGVSQGSVSIAGVGTNEYVTVPIATTFAVPAGSNTIDLVTTFPVGSGTVQTGSVAVVAYP